VRTPRSYYVSNRQRRNACTSSWNWTRSPLKHEEEEGGEEKIKEDEGGKEKEMKEAQSKI
jgi:hypothetical protein